MSDDASFTALDNPSSDQMNYNANSKMPRSHQNQQMVYGGHYNFYALSAESDQGVEAWSKAEDSICPFGWELPNNGSSNKSFQYLLIDSYGYEIGSVAETAAAIRKPPFTFSAPGAYDSTNGSITAQTAGGNIATGVVYGEWRSINVGYNMTQVYPGAANYKSYGFIARCVKK